jgi:hypothetical protein
MLVMSRSCAKRCRATSSASTPMVSPGTVLPCLPTVLESCSPVPGSQAGSGPPFSVGGSVLGRVGHPAPQQQLTFSSLSIRSALQASLTPVGTGQGPVKEECVPGSSYWQGWQSRSLRLGQGMRATSHMPRGGEKPSPGLGEA